MADPVIDGPTKLQRRIQFRMNQETIAGRVFAFVTETNVNVSLIPVTDTPIQILPGNRRRIGVIFGGGGSVNFLVSPGLNLINTLNENGWMVPNNGEPVKFSAADWGELTTLPWFGASESATTGSILVAEILVVPG